MLAHGKGPLGRGAFFLSLNQVIVSGLGFLFWILAARAYDSAAVGRGTSLLSAGVFLAILSTLGLPYALVRRLSSSSDPRRLFARVLAVTAGAGLAVGGLGGLAMAAVSREFAFLLEEPLHLLLLAAFVASYAVEVLLEQVLVAARRSEWSTAMVLVFASLRLVGPIAAPLGGSGEILLAWAGAMLAAVLFGLAVLVPRALASIEPAAGGEPPVVRPLLRYAGSNHVVTVAALAGPSLLPAAVLVALGGPGGAAAAAVFYVAFQVASLLLTVPVAIALVQFAEGSRPGSNPATDERRSLRLGLLVVLPGAALTTLLAPFLLGFFGPFYAAGGTVVLQVLAAASIAAVPAAILATRFRLAGRLRPAARAAALSSGIALGGALMSVPYLGLLGAGAAFLAGQTVAALTLWLSGEQSRRAGRAGPSESRSKEGSVDP